VTLPLIIIAYTQSSGVLLGAGQTAIALGGVAWLVAIWGLARGAGAVTRARLLGVEGASL
jgi:ABC-2 type transport system permease protein